MAPIKVWELAGADPKCVFSPFCWASRLALIHKGLEYESVPWCTITTFMCLLSVAVAFIVSLLKYEPYNIPGVHTTHGQCWPCINLP